MIFNQISKEIGTNGARKAQYNSYNYQPATPHSRMTSSNYLSGSRASE
jgi:hypothetical protein